MSAVYTVTEARDQRSIGFTGSDDRLNLNWTTSFNVRVTGVTAPADVDPYGVITATGLPIVNRSIYAFGGKIIPFMICRDKRAQMDPSNPFLWRVDCKYDGVTPTNSSEANNAPINPPATLSAITPRVTPELDETETVLYVDKSSTPKRIQLPSGNWWSEPVIERVPVLRLKITQYESVITYEQLLDRHLKVNSATYRTKARYSWLIENIEPVEVTVQLSGGPTSAALVTYTVTLSSHPDGWKEQRALFDTVFTPDAGSTWRPFLDGDPPVSRPATVTATGALKDNGKAATPDYVSYETFGEINYATFLQV